MTFGADNTIVARSSHLKDNRLAPRSSIKYSSEHLALGVLVERDRMYVRYRRGGFVVHSDFRAPASRIVEAVVLSKPRPNRGRDGAPFP